nr:MAG TPA: hypothetical protein [Caudoviricetes sp.]DAU14931.1 MAG TPA: hypothetical protein [Caudoviricetes sp.]DAY85759.1 MAG TPA: hypothetical protein [Caudoviricetes sp.]
MKPLISIRLVAFTYYLSSDVMEMMESANKELGRRSD